MPGFNCLYWIYHYESRSMWVTRAGERERLLFWGHTSKVTVGERAWICAAQRRIDTVFSLLSCFTLDRDTQTCRQVWGYSKAVTSWTVLTAHFHESTSNIVIMHQFLSATVHTRTAGLPHRVITWVEVIVFCSRTVMKTHRLQHVLFFSTS